LHYHDNIFHAYLFVTGDHRYKQSEGLSAQEQMITALPDVRTLMIDPAEDEFMVLACDGIWNSMSSQEVVDFVRPRIQVGQTKLSQICEEVKFSS
jgi:protein phosphatase 1G